MLHKLKPLFLKLFSQMFITTLNTVFQLFIVDMNFYGTFEQVSTNIFVASVISSDGIQGVRTGSREPVLGMSG